MSGELDIGKRVVSVNVPVEVCVKVEQAFTREGDKGRGVAFVRALEEATRDIVLTVENARAVADEIDANYRRRMERRNRK